MKPDSASSPESPDSRALAILVENHDHFLKYLQGRVGSVDVAEDLLQQGLVRAVQSEDRLLEHTNVVAWFYTVLRNLLIDHYRSQNTVDKMHQGFLDELVATGNDQSILTTELGKAICACMARLVPLLRREYGELIQRIDLSGEAPARVAEDLQITPGNLAVRLHRARLALRRQLEVSCGTCTEHACLECTCKQS